MINLHLTVFDNLASQITLDKLKDLSIILFIFAFQTVVSYLCSIATSKLFGFKKRPRNFVVAMAVCPPPFESRQSSLNAYGILPGLREFDFSPIVLGDFPVSDFARAPMGRSAW